MRSRAPFRNPDAGSGGDVVGRVVEQLPSEAGADVVEVVDMSRGRAFGRGGVEVAMPVVGGAFGASVGLVGGAAGGPRDDGVDIAGRRWDVATGRVLAGAGR